MQKLYINITMFQAKEMNLGGNMNGDGYQNGGTLVVDKGKFYITYFHKLLRYRISL